MTEFVPQAIDISEHVSAINIGDWLIQVLNVKKSGKVSKSYYESLYSVLQNSSGSLEPRTDDYVELFELFMLEADTVYSFLDDASDNGGAIILVVDIEGQKSIEKKVHKTYLEILKEVEQFFIVLMYIVSTRFPKNEPTTVYDAVIKMLQVLTKSPRHAESRLKLLKTLYNIFTEDQECRFSIFSYIVKYSAFTNQFITLLPYIKHLPEWMKDWNAEVSQKRELYLLVAQQLKILGRVDEAYPFLKRYIQLAPQYEHLPINSEGYWELMRTAEEFSMDSIRLPDVFYFDSILSLDALEVLASKVGEKYTSNLLALHRILSSGFPHDLESFQASNPHFFEELGINFDMCMDKIRLLSLTSLAVTHNDLTLSTVCETLKIDEDEAQELAVKAIGQGLIDAKIDQLNKVIHVRSAMQREFSTTQWNNLADKLKKWTENVNTLILAGKGE